MKKFISVIIAVLLIISSFAINVLATSEYSVCINCVATQSKAKGNYLVVYFKNIETGEEISRRITTTGNNWFTDIPVGEYEFVKCALEKNEDIIFELATEKQNLVVTGTEDVIYIFKVQDDFTETKEGALEELEQTEKMEIIYVLCSLGIFVLLILWGIFAILGRKRRRIKMISKLLFHLLFALIGFFVGAGIMNGDFSRFDICIKAACFPFGFFLVSAIKLISDANSEHIVIPPLSVTITKWIVVAVISYFLGMIICPITLIVDIYRIITANKATEK